MPQVLETNPNMKSPWQHFVVENPSLEQHHGPQYQDLLEGKLLREALEAFATPELKQARVKLRQFEPLTTYLSGFFFGNFKQNSRDRSHPLEKTELLLVTLLCCFIKILQNAIPQFCCLLSKFPRL